MNKANSKKLALLFLLVSIQSSCHLYIQPMPTKSDSPTAPLPNMALPTPTLFLASATIAPPPSTQALPTETVVPTTAPAVRLLGQHQVRTGETLFCIARAYGVLPSAIMQINNITNVDSLSVGQILYIPEVQWIDMPAGPVCDKQINSPFPAGPTTASINSPTSFPSTYEDLKQELYVSLGGGGGQGTDCMIIYTVDSPPSPSVSGFWNADFLSNKGLICIFGFPLDKVITVSLLDRQDGNVLYIASFIVQEQGFFQINSSGQIIEKVGFADSAYAPVSIIELNVWPDPNVEFVKVTTTDLHVESNISSLGGVFVDFPIKSAPAFDPFGKFPDCPEYEAGSEVILHGSGFMSDKTITINIYGTKAGLGQSNYPDAIHQTNEESAEGGTVLTIDKLFTTLPVTPNKDGTFRITLPTNSLSPTGPYFVQYDEANLSSSGGNASIQNCFAITNRQVVHAYHVSSPPRIDGDTHEWATLMNMLDRVTYGSENWSGFSDLSGWFSVAWDETFLYVAASIVDDHYVQTQRNELIFMGDSIEVLMGDPVSLQTGLRSTDYQLGFSLGNLQTNEPPAQPYLWYPMNKRGLPAGVLVRGKQKSRGYDVEVAIPWAVLERVPALGQQFKFAVSASDNDTEGIAAQESLISSVPTRILMDPTTWGILLLSD